jgi:uracil phosphoribosyltransferase
MDPRIVILKNTPQVLFLHSKIRDKNTDRTDFVFYSDRLIRLLVEEALNHLPMKNTVIETPTGSTYSGVVPEAEICGISIMRAGESMERALSDTCRGVRIGKILIQRDESSPDKTPSAKYNYSKVPQDIKNRHVLLLDPMLATGGSAKKACDCLVNEYGVAEDKIIFVNIISCMEGINKLLNAYPKLKIITSCIDPVLNEDKYIMPGLGDFGNNYFGT